MAGQSWARNQRRRSSLVVKRAAARPARAATRAQQAQAEPLLRAGRRVLVLTAAALRAAACRSAAALARPARARARPALAERREAGRSWAARVVPAAREALAWWRPPLAARARRMLPPLPAVRAEFRAHAARTAPRPACCSWQRWSWAFGDSVRRLEDDRFTLWHAQIKESERHDPGGSSAAQRGCDRKPHCRWNRAWVGLSQRFVAFWNPLTHHISAE
jgi:hypothetical protein